MHVRTANVNKLFCLLCPQFISLMFHCGLAVLPYHSVVTDSFRCKTFLTCGHRKLRSCLQVANESMIALNFKFSVIFL